MTQRTPQEAMKRIFSREALMQRWLDVEAALARAEASLGMIPNEAAEEISRRAKVELLDMKKMEETQQQVWLPTVAFIRTFQSICAEDTGQYIHWGATSQDLTDTAEILQLKEAYGVIYRSLRQIEADLLDLAERHASTVMAGRTHGVHALPITFGYKAAIWAREIRRHIERLKECRKRLLVGQLSGAVGTLASFGEKGPEVQTAMLKRELDLEVPDIAWHASRDRFAEFVNLLAMIAATLARIANEVHLLMSTEIGEVSEPWQKGFVGSSTMPHKRNPFITETMMSLAKKVRYDAALITEVMVVEHERDGNFLSEEADALAESCIIMGELLTYAESLTKGMVIYPERMKKNLGILRGLMMSEGVMLELGYKIGKQTAHSVVREDSIKDMEENVEFKRVLLEDPRVKQYLSESDIDRILDPVRYVGLAPQIAKDAVALSRKEREKD
jgi:3-carboxy-cis,cis-muconate cycloisomerase